MTTVVSVAQGGTGSNNAAAARTSLGAAPSAAYDQANNAYAAANTASSTGGGGYDQANAAYGQANAAYLQANNAYLAANNSNLKLGGVITGTLNVTQDIIVGGNVYLEGNTTYINVATYSIEDSLMYLASNNSLTDSVDIGFMGGKNTSGTYSHTGLARDATDGKYKLFDGLAEEGHVGNVVDFANTYLATLVANVEANTLTVVNGVSGNVNFDSGTLFVDSVGNAVGIGTSSPSSKLDVLGKVSINSDGTLNWGNAKDYGRLTWDTGKAIVRGESGKGLSLGANGTQDYLYVATSGNIGVGTTSPTDTLGYGRALDIQSNAGAAVYLRDSDNTGEYTSLGYEGGSAKNFSIYNTAAGDVRIYTSGSQRLTVSSVGNVGIGTISPGYKLDVNGSISASGELITQGNDARLSLYRSGGINYFDWSSGQSLHFSTQTSSGGAGRSTKMTLTDGGNVGIGTTSPSGLWSGDERVLHLSSSGGTAAGIRISSVNATAEFFSSAGSIEWGLYSTTASPFTIYTNNSHRFRITSDGNVGIGTTNPASKLSVRGTTDLGDSHDSTTSSLHTTRISGYALRYDASNRYGNYGILILNASAGWTSGARRYMITSALDTSKFAIIRSVDATTDPALGDAGAISSGTADFVINNSGNIGIGTTSPGAKLHVSGGGIRIPANTWIDSENSVNLIRDGRFGYSDSYRVVQIGINSSTTRAISLGYDPSVNPSGGFTGNEIIIPNNIAIIAPTSDNSGFVGVLRIDSANNLCIGGGNYQTTGHIFVNNTTGNVGIGTTNPSQKLHVVGNILANGCPVQVQYTSSATRVTVDSTSFVEASTNYRVAITPKSTSSMIRLRFFIPTNADGQSNTIYTLRLFRIIGGTTSYALTSAGSSNGSRNVIAGSTFRPLNGYDGNDPMPMIIDAVDFPNTTSTCTYGFEFKRETGGSGTVHFGKSSGDNSNWGFDADIVIIAEEIGQ